MTPTLNGGAAAQLLGSVAQLLDLEIEPAELHRHVDDGVPGLDWRTQLEHLAPTAGIRVTAIELTMADALRRAPELGTAVVMGPRGALILAGVSGL